MAIIKEIEKLFRGFLWCQGEFKKGKAKVKWDIVCLPKEEGGLGIKRLKFWNIALMTSHFWRLMTSKQSLWVRWIHEYRLSNSNIWEVTSRPDSAWSWRRLLHIRQFVRKFFVFQIGDRKTASAWFDSWNGVPLAEFIPLYEIVRAGFHFNSKVCDVFNSEGPTWPSDWFRKFTQLRSIAAPQLSNSNDTVGWRENDAVVHRCSVSIVWNSIRPSASKVPGLKFAKMVVAKLCFAATVYFIWQERNWRIFRNSRWSEDQVYDVIYSNVRLKLMKVIFKPSGNVDRLKMDWHLG
ncbi:uncharacterized protein [Rutidosis leptorrhynchoides]|uniref:uncharacterized protein n=1 Tax=Rutidosis leptorrhynchoides TaxID=125765 RepID=UPI003A99794A